MLRRTNHQQRNGSGSLRAGITAVALLLGSLGQGGHQFSFLVTVRLGYQFGYPIGGIQV